MCPKNQVFNYLNKEIQFTLSKASFDNNFYIMHKYHDSYSSPAGEFTVTEAPTISFSNTRAVISVPVEANGSQAVVDLVGKPRVNTVQVIMPDGIQRNTTQILFDLETYDCYVLKEGESGSVDVEKLQELVRAQMTTAIEQTALQINNVPFMDLYDFNIMLDNQLQILRIVGDNPEECPIDSN